MRSDVRFHHPFRSKENNLLLECSKCRERLQLAVKRTEVETMAKYGNALVELITSDELAGQLGVSERTLSRWFRLRKGPPRVKVGRRVLYRQTAIGDWLSRQEVDCRND